MLHILMGLIAVKFCSKEFGTTILLSPAIKHYLLGLRDIEYVMLFLHDF